MNPNLEYCLKVFDFEMSYVSMGFGSFDKKLTFK